VRFWVFKSDSFASAKLTNLTIHWWRWEKITIFFRFLKPWGHETLAIWEFAFKFYENFYKKFKFTGGDGKKSPLRSTTCAHVDKKCINFTYTCKNVLLVSFILCCTTK